MTYIRVVSLVSYAVASINMTRKLLANWMV